VSALSALLAAPKTAAARSGAKAAISASGVSAASVFVALSAACAIGNAAKTPLALEALYDEEVLTEADVLKWHSSPDGDAALKARAQPFVAWLQEADDDDDEEEEEEE
jgi:hypothetical protein